jgi:dTDP-4-amino-4,6-dideoxygalactose transaminase
MRVPLLDLKPQLDLLGDEMKTAIDAVIESGMYILGPRVEEFERAAAAYCGARHAIGMSSGTDALLAALMALDLKAGDLVLTSPYSFFATAGAIWRTGARPVFVDIDPVTYNLDPAKVRAWFDEHPKDAARVKAIVPVHLYGQCVDMDPLIALACERGLPVVEDAAQAIGATYPSREGVRQAGTMGLSGCYSFFPSKNLGCLGDGGMTVTSDDAHAARLRRIRNHGMEPKYYHREVGANFRIDAIQAAVLSVKLPHLNAWHEQRRDNAAYYDAHLKAPGVTTPMAVYGREHHIYNQYVIRVPERREELREFLNRREIGHDVYYPVPFHLQECFRELGYRAGDFPGSEDAAAHTLAIPVYPGLSRAQQDFVIESLTEFFSS